MSTGLLIGILFAVGIPVAIILLGKDKGASAEGLEPPSKRALDADAPEEDSAVQAAEASDTSAPFKRVTLELQGNVYGPVPPFGTLEAVDDGFVFTAQARVVAADEAGIATGDAASTIQSMGTMDFGEFRFQFPVADVADGALEGVGADDAIELHISGALHRFNALGGRNDLLATWLRARGVS